ncbi:MAG: hypothetical protein RLZZ241_1663 [Bacteroidota bacterium]|jgi:hypothetical protein
MRTLIRYLSLAIVLFSLTAIVYGFTLPELPNSQGDRYIGFGVCGIFLLAMPLFLFSESRGKKWENYMLNAENIRKMQNKAPKS